MGFPFLRAMKPNCVSNRETGNSERYRPLSARAETHGDRPRWLVDQYATRLPIAAIRLGQHGIAKQIHLSVRSADLEVDYISGFLSMSKPIIIEKTVRDSVFSVVRSRF